MIKGILLLIYKIIETLLLFVISSYIIATILFWEPNPINWGNDSLVICRIYILSLSIISITLTYRKIINEYWSQFQTQYIFENNPDGGGPYYNSTLSLARLKQYIINNKIFYFKNNTLYRFIYGYSVFSTLIAIIYLTLAFICWDLTFWDKGQYIFVIMRILAVVCIFIAIGCVYCSFLEKVEDTFFAAITNCVNEKDLDGAYSSSCYAYKLIKQEMLTNVKFVLLLFDFCHTKPITILGIKL